MNQDFKLYMYLKQCDIPKYTIYKTNTYNYSITFMLIENKHTIFK